MAVWPFFNFCTEQGCGGQGVKITPCLIEWSWCVDLQTSGSFHLPRTLEFCSLCKFRSDTLSALSGKNYKLNWIQAILTFQCALKQVQDSSKFECGIDRCNLSHVWDYVTTVALGNSCIYTQWAPDFWSNGFAGPVIAVCPPHLDLFLAVLSSRNGLLFVGTSPESGMDLLDKTIATVSVFAK